MKKPPVLLIVIVLNLIALVALAFVYPHLMISPGPLAKGHAELATDCFACHTPWRGASSARCTECHAVADIGLRTTQGQPISQGTIKGSFHQKLIEQDCMACHGDHQGSKLAQRSRKAFSHDLLKASMREACGTCHAAPEGPLHRGLKAECSTCHQTQAWTPATFEHDEHFVLDRDHRSPCDTCHRNNDYARYTCYGCHEHTPAKIRAEHVEEGISNFENCVECHRDPGVEPEKPGRGRRDRKERD